MALKMEKSNIEGCNLAWRFKDFQFTGFPLFMCTHHTHDVGEDGTRRANQCSNNCQQVVFQQEALSTQSPARVAVQHSNDHRHVSASDGCCQGHTLSGGKTNVKNHSSASLIKKSTLEPKMSIKNQPLGVSNDIQIQLYNKLRKPLPSLVKRFLSYKITKHHC